MSGPETFPAGRAPDHVAIVLDDSMLDGPGAHDPRIVFAFAEAQNDAAGGLYAEGPVVHGYVECACGARYSDRWVVDPA